MAAYDSFCDTTTTGGYNSTHCPPTTYPMYDTPYDYQKVGYESYPDQWQTGDNNTYYDAPAPSGLSVIQVIL